MTLIPRLDELKLAVDGVRACNETVRSERCSNPQQISKFHSEEPAALAETTRVLVCIHALPWCICRQEHCPGNLGNRRAKKTENDVDDDLASQKGSLLPCVQILEHVHVHTLTTYASCCRSDSSGLSLVLALPRATPGFPSSLSSCRAREPGPPPKQLYCGARSLPPTAPCPFLPSSPSAHPYPLPVLSQCSVSSALCSQ